MKDTHTSTALATGAPSLRAGRNRQARAAEAAAASSAGRPEGTMTVTSPTVPSSLTTRRSLRRAVTPSARAPEVSPGASTTTCQASGCAGGSRLMGIGGSTVGTLGALAPGAVPTGSPAASDGAAAGDSAGTAAGADDAAGV